MDTILVIGATGNIGREVVKALSAAGYQVKAASRSPEKITAAETVSPVRFSFEDRTTYNAALEGVQGVFLIAPPLDAEADEKAKPFIDLAKKAGISHLVFLSAVGMNRNGATSLGAIEDYVKNAGLNFTILRSNFFMENFSTGSGSDMIKKGGIFVAAGDGRTSFISAEDVAKAVAAAFSGKLYGKVFDLTGMEAIDYTRVAKTISAATGKTIAYYPIAEEMMLQSVRDIGVPEPSVQYMASLYRIVRNGHTALVTNDFEKLTGAKPLSFEEFASKNADRWK